MSSRQEQKEQRKRERLEAEAAAEASAGRARRLRIIGGAILAVAAVAAIVVVILAGGDKDGDKADPDEVAAAAKSAGCTLKKFRSEGQEHVTSKVRYKTNPPTSGSHNPTPAPDGVYDAGNEPQTEATVHTLEHGRVIYQYRKGAPKAVVDQLRRKVSAKPYHALLLQNQTGMKPLVAATAWTRSITCNTFNPKVSDALGKFQAAFTDKAPEFVP